MGLQVKMETFMIFGILYLKDDIAAYFIFILKKCTYYWFP